MQYPLTIEQFQYPEFEKGIGMEMEFLPQILDGKRYSIYGKKKLLLQAYISADWRQKSTAA